MVFCVDGLIALPMADSTPLAPRATFPLAAPPMPVMIPPAVPRMESPLACVWPMGSWMRQLPDSSASTVSFT